MSRQRPFWSLSLPAERVVWSSLKPYLWLLLLIFLQHPPENEDERGLWGDEDNWKQLSPFSTHTWFNPSSLSGNWRYCDNCAQTIDNFFSDTHMCPSRSSEYVVHPNESKRKRDKGNWKNCFGGVEQWQQHRSATGNALFMMIGTTGSSINLRRSK